MKIKRNITKAYWWYEPNFGDALNPYLLERLSGSKVIYHPRHRPFFKRELKRLLEEGLSFDWRRFYWPLHYNNIVLAIGSMLRFAKAGYKVWGAGFMHDTDICEGGDFYAVRGPYSAQRLVDLGFTHCNVYGDPALLLPLVYQPESKNKSHNVALIPHMVEYEKVRKLFPQHKVINLKTYDVEQIIKDICSSTYVLSTSLHGVIVAHAYGIPALWIKDGDIGTDGIKFKDYFSSVDLPLYEGNFDMEALVTKQFDDFEEELKQLMLPKIDKIKDIQRNLLNVAPFELCDKYKPNIVL